MLTLYQAKNTNIISETEKSIRVDSLNDEPQNIQN